MEANASSSSSSTSPSDLRRSKRNKFHLDVVAAVHGSSKKMKMEALSVDTSDDSAQGRRSKRKSAAFRDFGFSYPDDVDLEDEKGFYGDFMCNKCPARFDTKSGINNHMKNHGGELRRFACELCDFSACSVQAINRHNRLHRELGVVTVQNSPNVIENKATTSQAPDLVAANEEPFMQNSDDDPLPPPLLLPEIAKGAAKETENQRKPIKWNPSAEARRLRQCPHCPHYAKTADRLQKHLTGHSLRKGFICPAKNCTFKCASSGFLKRHTEIHDEPITWPPIYVNMDEIEKKTKLMENRSIAFLKSYKKHYDGLRCNFSNCEFVAYGYPELMRHKIHTHKANSLSHKKFICIECGQRFADWTSRRLHKLRRHSNEKQKFITTRYLKEVVGETFLINYMSSLFVPKIEVSVKEALEDKLDESFEGPEKINQDDQVFKCDLCPYMAVTASRVERHRDKHFAPGDFKCSHCTFACRSEETVKQHERLHMEIVEVKEEPEPKRVVGEPSEHQVKILGTALKRWWNENKLDRKAINDNFVLSNVNGQRMFLCMECPYASKYRGDIRAHKARHSMEQDFRCSQCTYSAQRPVSLRDHYKLHITFNATMKDKNVAEIIIKGHYIGERRGTGRHQYYTCKCCPYMTSSIGCLYRHNRYHKKKPEIHLCSCCSYSSIDKEKMDEHLVVHGANGTLDAYVRRVNNDGKPIPMLTDYASDYASKKQYVVMMAAAMANAPESTTLKTATKAAAAAISQSKGEMKKIATAARTKSESPPLVKLAQKNSRSIGGIPTSKSAKGSLNNSKAPTPTPSNVDLVKYERIEGQEHVEAADEKKLDEKIELTHFAMREFLRKEKAAERQRTCPDCPYHTTDLTLFRHHRQLHFNENGPRQFACCECSYSSNTASSLQSHLQLHQASSGGTEGMTFRKKNNFSRRAEVIPAGAKYYQCTTQNCSFKTVKEATFLEHRHEHRRQLWSRLSAVTKRAGGRDDYQKPRIKFQNSSKSVLNCNKCSFRCVGINAHIAHVDRHGWNNIHKCRMCDYSDATKQVVQFHEMMHHISNEQTLTDTEASLKYVVKDGFVQQPMMDGVEKPSVEQIMKRAGSAIKCPMCDFICHLGPELAFHISQAHANEDGAKEMESYLHMGFLPPSLTTVPSSC